MRTIQLLGSVWKVLFAWVAFTVMLPAYILSNGAKLYAEQVPVKEIIAVTTPTPGEFPIVASTVFNDLTGPRKEDLKGIKDCGFNVCMHNSRAEVFEELLGYMEGTGLKLMPYNSSFAYIPNVKEEKWKDELRLFVNRFKDNPLLAGWEFADEPRWNQLEQRKNRYDYLCSLDSTHFVLVNLVGMIAKEFTGPCKTLGEYLDSIQNKFDLHVWSSDYYPIIIRTGELVVNYGEYYADLQAYSSKSKETGLPMWSYCESMQFHTNHHDTPAATVPYLSFEAFSALAYGAQGIVYWTYWQRPSNSYETYISALVDLDGNKTPAWYAAQTVNRQIRALTPVFLGAEMVECRHTGDIQMKNKVDQISDFGPLSKLTNGNKGVLASHLKNGEKDYLLIVNHDVQSNQRVKMNFAKDAVVSELKVSSSGNVTRKKVGGALNVTLTPGGYCLLEWSR